VDASARAALEVDDDVRERGVDSRLLHDHARVHPIPRQVGLDHPPVVIQPNLATHVLTTVLHNLSGSLLTLVMIDVRTPRRLSLCPQGIPHLSSILDPQKPSNLPWLTL
jgi:hypothetical protein